MAEVNDNELNQLLLIDTAARAFVDACPKISERCRPQYESLLKALYDGCINSASANVRRKRRTREQVIEDMMAGVVQQPHNEKGDA